MRKSNQPLLRSMLRKCDDGLTVSQLAKATDLCVDHITRSLKCMPDVYIDRWVYVPTNHKHAAVWSIVVPPENCPKPEPRTSK